MKCQDLILSISITVFTLYSRPAILLFLDHSQAKLIRFLLYIINILTIPSLPPAIFSVSLTILFLLRYISLLFISCLSYWKLLCRLSICCIWLRSLPLVFATVLFTCCFSSRAPLQKDMLSIHRAQACPEFLCLAPKFCKVLHTFPHLLIPIF